MNTRPITFANIFNWSELLVSSIEIPIVQRDYAQGRGSKEVSRIREGFLDVLTDALTGKSGPVKLDFVYGNVQNGKLIPLDGQQRLTTLFLLHWYVGKHENVPGSELNFLKQFTYKVRFSTQHFCENLVNSMPNFNVGALSEWITDQSWFMYSWEKDPTIQSMLVVIDAIHLRLRNESNMWPLLMNESDPLISFYFLPLEEMGLTDSLYIKMNSRGKPLTEFEHFKAEFEKIIKQVSPSLMDKFSHKVDVDWSDMLWRYRQKDDDIDSEFMNYFRFVTETICILCGIELVENDFELANSVYGVQNPDAINNIDFLFKSFDCWQALSDIDTFFTSIFSQHSFEDGKVKLYTDTLNLFKDCCQNYLSLDVDQRRSFSLNKMLLLYAVLIYLFDKVAIPDSIFKERIRIVRNLINNSPDEIRQDRLNALLKDVRSIMLDGIVNLHTMSFNEIQKNEEIEKQKWRKQNESLISDLNALEDHVLLQGSIAIIGIENPDKFKNRAAKFHELFDDSISFHRISQALLTIGDYSQLVSWRFIFGNENNSTWRELFTVSKQRKNYKKTQSIVLQLLDTLRTDIDGELNTLINNYLSSPFTIKDWRYYFVKYPAMRSGKSGVYWWKNDPLRAKENQYEIIMMNTAVKTSGKHWDPFLFVLSKIDDWRQYFSLDEYDAPLVINKTSQKIRCKNSLWEIYSDSNELEQSIAIPQESGIDMVDRIELLLKHLNQPELVKN